MSVPFGLFVLTLDDITKQMRRTFERFTDPRKRQEMGSGLVQKTRPDPF